MPALVAGIHVLLSSSGEDVDGRVKPGHDELSWLRIDVARASDAIQ
jgi:hypothetical protein